MIAALKSDRVVNKVGGKFRLVALIQKRLKELIEGARPLVDPHGKTFVEIAVQEIDEDKIAIDYDHTEQLEIPDKITLEQHVHPG